MPLDPEKQAHWAEHHRRWQASGLSQRQYCQQESLSLSSFDRWRGLIRRAGTSAPQARSTPQKLTLVPTQVRGDARGTVSNIVLQSPKGWQVTLPDAWDEEALMQLLPRLP